MRTITIKINNQEKEVKLTNIKYEQLRDLDALYELLKVKCITHVAKDLGVPQNSIRSRVERHFPEEWKKNIVQGRKRHKRKTGKKYN